MNERIAKILCALFSVLLLVVTPAIAVDELGLFELDGNATDSGGSGDDWETLYNGGGSADTFTGVTPDPSPVSIFTGGRKDIQEINKWGWKDGEVPDKGDITNAYAAAYSNLDDDLIIYFGADRVANAGDTFLGFWFFKQEITLGNGTFIGDHTPGDVLVLANFPQASNAQPLVQVVEWDPTCSKADSNNPQVDDCAAENLRLRAGVEGAGAICSPDVDPQLACAIANTEGGDNDPTDSPWPYTSKDGYIDQFPYETFFSGGINISDLIDGDACFASFMAETRSSSSFTAALKDFVLDSFPVCSISVTKSCTNPRLNATQDMIIYDIGGTVSNDGTGTVYGISVADNPAFDQGTLSLGSLPGKDDVNYSATITVPLIQNGTDDTVTALANTASDGFSGTALSASDVATCPNLQISPGLSIIKNCTTSLTISGGLVAAQVNVSGEVCNVGDSNLHNVAVTDDKAGNLLSGASLVAPTDINDPGATPGACLTYSGSYLPDEAKDNQVPPQDTTDPSAVIFSDTATATALDVFGNAVVPQSDMAFCPLCPTCPTCP